MQNIKDLEALLRSDVSIITIETQEGPALGLFDRIRLSVPALYLAYSKNESLVNKHILKELKQSRPLSIVMTERIASLRHRGKDQTVLAN